MIWNAENCSNVGSVIFEGCSKLEEVTFGADVKTIHPEAFGGCSDLESIIVSDGNTKYHISGNCLIETETKTLILGCKNSIIPGDGSVTKVGIWAFSGRSGLTNIIIPDSVTSIEIYAFFGCSGLTSITIPDSVRWLGWRAFQRCSGLTTVTMGRGVETIQDFMFTDCNNLTSVTIPDNVKSIGDQAFSGCGKLANITFSGTKEQWNKIKKGSSWNFNTGNYIIHCTDGDIAKS